MNPRVKHKYYSLFLAIVCVAGILFLIYFFLNPSEQDNGFKRFMYIIWFVLFFCYAVINIRTYLQEKKIILIF